MTLGNQTIGDGRCFLDEEMEAFDALGPLSRQALASARFQIGGASLVRALKSAGIDDLASPVADRNKRNAIIIELNPEYAAMADRRIRGDSPLFAVTKTAIERPAPAKQEVLGI